MDERSDAQDLLQSLLEGGCEETEGDERIWFALGDSLWVFIFSVAVNI